jgi:hypothetical protein
MSLVFAGVCSHAPGITGRAHLADAEVKDEFHRQFNRMGEQLREAKPDAVIIIAAEHFANFFMNNMPRGRSRTRSGWASRSARCRATPASRRRSSAR